VNPKGSFIEGWEYENVWSDDIAGFGLAILVKLTLA